MLPATIIAHKRDGGKLTSEEISFFLRGYVAGTIPDYQMSALAMAVYLRGMDDQETAALTLEMLHSGDSLVWPAAEQPTVDKHSTGGIGDKVSLVLAPLLACCGVRVPMISGRGLGATGGTLDKLESIPGFRTDLNEEEIRRLVDEVGCVITGATANLAPADRKLYALRDVTGTVASIPLITASIMCKKLAESLDALVLDVKFGSGAFMKTFAAARELAQSMVDVGRQVGVSTVAVLTDMNQPLGRMAGNAVEVNESLDVLAGAGPADVRELTLALAAELLTSAGATANAIEARQLAQRHLDSGRALEKFRAMVAAQGGDLESERSIAPAKVIDAEQGGFVAAIDTQQIGLAIVELGGGRKNLADQIDHSVGIETLVRLGDPVRVGDPLLRVFAGNLAATLGDSLRAAIRIDEQAPAPTKLIHQTVR
ncbi:MAG: thymidine phosphorylase [Planctomycetales bacterium]|nr:thymidine phosphorylase [Planctomycetales bacterium]